ncbi:hypothetical protein COO91_02283 [Nostoc flagelliforme CCNUN1]|uniref:Uncharacterized protein n=1 Tax=Nostoc flagelliforme CCNUN1 TaxID=2038116 RepID=A0A2K8SLQ7_9NOSO|nr:hypothetical protein COO91_02283 [Nostoc flagelliforme CCNUN1]
MVAMSTTGVAAAIKKRQGSRGGRGDKGTRGENLQQVFSLVPNFPFPLFLLPSGSCLYCYKVSS